MVSYDPTSEACCRFYTSTAMPSVNKLNRDGTMTQLP